MPNILLSFSLIDILIFKIFFRIFSFQIILLRLTKKKCQSKVSLLPILIKFRKI